MKKLPIGNDDFREIRSKGFYYVDKSLMIQEFLDMQDKVALIARPRRFGKTLNMTMIREFFDITKESREIFAGLAIMDTESASKINSQPVIYLTFKDCKGICAVEVFSLIKQELYREYRKYEEIFRGGWQSSYDEQDFYAMLEVLRNPQSTYIHFVAGLQLLTAVVGRHYSIPPILLIDEYDQPIISSYEYGYHGETATFFANFYGKALKGNPDLSQALLTGVQRVAKESIFSQLNNPKIYTVLSRQYALYFGLTENEASELLEYYGLKLDSKVKKMYDGYRISGVDMYNPWSVLNYGDNGFLDNYWVNTSSNYLVRHALSKANKSFWDDFDKLAAGKETVVWLNLDTSYAERESNYSLWGLLVNAGYITITERISAASASVKIPNEEAMGEFIMLITEIAGIEGQGLEEMFDCLIHKDIERFLQLYSEMVIACTSYMDASENAYHMLFLGMGMTLRNSYSVRSNIESGFGRSDIIMQAASPLNPNVIIEFKQGEDIEGLKETALKQIIEKQYFTGLKGEIICVGIAHDKKRCAVAYKTISR